jgi:hypothetical protein
MTSKSEGGIDVLGVCLKNVYDGFGPFRSSASKILLQHGLGRRRPGKLAEFDAAAWYPLGRFLDALGAIAKEAGEGVLYNAGEAVPANAQWPPQARDVYTALESVDVAYHMNHGRGRSPLFDPSNGRMGEGIGHYRAQRTGDYVQVVAENPYPCEFDRGLLTAIARQFKPRARVQHAEGTACRKFRGASCTYDVAW